MEFTFFFCFFSEDAHFYNSTFTSLCTFDKNVYFDSLTVLPARSGKKIRGKSGELVIYLFGNLLLYDKNTMIMYTIWIRIIDFKF